jgi:hypothetical protein
MTDKPIAHTFHIDPVSGESIRDEVEGWPNEAAMRVINPDQWEPCSPEWLEKGGDCHCAPRVWNAADKNHWHPKINSDLAAEDRQNEDRAAHKR